MRHQWKGSTSGRLDKRSSKVRERTRKDRAWTGKDRERPASCALGWLSLHWEGAANNTDVAVEQRLRIQSPREARF